MTGRVKVWPVYAVGGRHIQGWAVIYEGRELGFYRNRVSALNYGNMVADVYGLTRR